MPGNNEMQQKAMHKNKTSILRAVLGAGYFEERILFTINEYRRNARQQRNAAKGDVLTT